MISENNLVTTRRCALNSPFWRPCPANEFAEKNIKMTIGWGAFRGTLHEQPPKGRRASLPVVAASILLLICLEVTLARSQSRRALMKIPVIRQLPFNAGACFGLSKLKVFSKLEFTKRKNWWKVGTYKRRRWYSASDKSDAPLIMAKVFHSGSNSLERVQSVWFGASWQE